MAYRPSGFYLPHDCRAAFGAVYQQDDSLVLLPHSYDPIPTTKDTKDDYQFDIDLF